MAFRKIAEAGASYFFVNKKITVFDRLRFCGGAMWTCLPKAANVTLFEIFLPKKLVGLCGLEPQTSSLSVTRSNQLSYIPWYGGVTGIQTLDLCLAKAAL